MAPCNKKGKEYTEKDDKFVDSPDELIGKDLHFLFKIVNCRGLPNKYTDVYCKYRVYLDEKVGSPVNVLFCVTTFCHHRTQQLRRSAWQQTQTTTTRNNLTSTLQQGTFTIYKELHGFTIQSNIAIEETFP